MNLPVTLLLSVFPRYVVRIYSMCMCMGAGDEITCKMAKLCF